MPQPALAAVRRRRPGRRIRLEERIEYDREILGAPNSVLFRKTGVESRVIDAGTVLVDMRSGTVFELNRVGGEIWELLSSGITESAICECLTGRYRVERRLLEADVAKLIVSLADAGLIETKWSDDPSPRSE